MSAASDRQYGRDDVDYATWYSDWMRQLARSYTRGELERMLYGASSEAAHSARSHLRAVQRSTSIGSNSQARAQARNATAAAGDYGIALRGALEIHDLFPEHARGAP
jgi:hypothetical protein